MNFGFERIYNYDCYMTIIREISTDCLYIQYSEPQFSRGYSSGLTVMLDPTTGKPLTYANWKEKYANK